MPETQIAGIPVEEYKQLVDSWKPGDGPLPPHLLAAGQLIAQSESPKRAKEFTVMTTPTGASRLSAKDKAFRKAYGHLPSECLPGCERPRTNGATTHRQSLTRPGDMAGKPFTETWAEMKARKAARLAGGNGPVLQVQAPKVQAQAPTSPDAQSAILKAISKLGDNMNNSLAILEARIARLEASK